MKSSLQILVSCLLSVSWYAIQAQGDTTRTGGEIISGEIVIEKDKQIILPKAEKVYLRTSVTPIVSSPIPQKFRILEPVLTWPAYTSNIAPVRQAEYPRSVDYQNYIKLGLGNYQHALVDAGLFNELGAWNTSAKFFLDRYGIGPVNEDQSGNTVGSVELRGSRRFGDLSVSPYIAYRGSKFNYFGNANAVDRSFPEVAEDGVISSLSSGINTVWQSEKLSMYMTPSISFTNHTIKSTEEENRETVFEMDGGIAYSIKKGSQVGASLSYQGAGYSGGIAYNRYALNFSPYYQQVGERVSYSIGLNLSPSGFDESNSLGVYPVGNVELDLDEKLTTYATISGGRQLNQFTEVSAELQFLDDSLLLLNQDKRYKALLGLKGNLSGQLSFDLSLSYAQVLGLPFFIPSSSDSSRYQIISDVEPVGITSFIAKVEYMPQQRSVLGASLSLNGFTTETLDEPWHQPSFILKAYGSHTIKEKWILSSYFTTMAGIQAPTGFGAVNLSAFIDLGAGVKYLFSERASAFLDINNLLNNEYERYLGFPTRGLTVRLGAQYRF